MHRGYIKLHRCITDNKLWTGQEFSRGQAWVDILLLTTHKETSVRIRGIRVDLQPGQAAASVVWLADRWQWSQGKVKRFLYELEMDEQIEQQKNNVSTVITVTNWKLYQGDGIADGIANSIANGEQTASRRRANGDIQEGKEWKEEIQERENSACAVNDGTEDIPPPPPSPAVTNIPPDVETVVAAATMMGIRADFTRDWYDDMTSQGWLDNDRRPCAYRWRALLKTYWNTEKSRQGRELRKETGYPPNETEDQRKKRLARALFNGR